MTRAEKQNIPGDSSLERRGVPGGGKSFDELLLGNMEAAIAGIVARRRYKLTPREVQVIVRLVTVDPDRPSTDANIAEDLGTARPTIANQLVSIGEKLNARNRTMIAVIALREHIVD